MRNNMRKLTLTAKARIIISKLFKAPHKFISIIGEITDINFLRYNLGTFIEFDIDANRNAAALIPILKSRFSKIDTVCDIGCGTGRYLQAFTLCGIKAWGYEYSPVARWYARKINKQKVYSFDVTKSQATEFEGAADLAITIEVAEHINPEFAKGFVDFVCKAAPMVVFCAAQPGQGGVGHINLQTKSYWEELFLLNGYLRDKVDEEHVRDCLLSLDKITVSLYLIENLMIFKEHISDHK
jgi:SAM-dependent methyltransferase